MARVQEYTSKAEKQKAYRERKRNAETSKSNADKGRIDQLYDQAIDAIRQLYQYCDETNMELTVASIAANGCLQRIASAAWDAQSNSLYRRRTNSGIWTQSHMNKRNGNAGTKE